MKVNQCMTREVHIADPADTLQVIPHLPLLVLQLFGIRQHLPLATAANTKMGTKRLHSFTG